MSPRERAEFYTARPTCGEVSPWDEQLFERILAVERLTEQYEREERADELSTHQR